MCSCVYSKKHSRRSNKTSDLHHHKNHNTILHISINLLIQSNFPLDAKELSINYQNIMNVYHLPHHLLWTALDMMTDQRNGLHVAVNVSPNFLWITVN